jgi:hypothetical protein
MTHGFKDRPRAKATACISAGALAFALTVINSAAEAKFLDSGWWVVVASFPKDPPDRQWGDLQGVRAIARRCRLRTFQ